MAIVAACASTVAGAQLPAIAPEREGCIDAVVLAGERHDFSTGQSGHGTSVDWLHCIGSPVSYGAGAATFSIAGSRWTYAKSGATLRFAAGHVGLIQASLGSGHNGEGRFAYRKLAGGILFKAAANGYAKGEIEYFDIDENRGNVLKLGAVFLPDPSVSFEALAARSIGGSLPIRSLTGRVDWAGGVGRIFAGLSHGRLGPQVQELATGERVPDVISRQYFGGGAIRLQRAELIAALESQRTAASRRTTFTLAVQYPFR